MLDGPSLVEHARKLLHEEWHRNDRRGGDVVQERDCPAMWLLPQFVEMMAESCDQPATDFTATIKRLIVEHTFHGLCGDHASDIGPADLGAKAIEHQVRVVVRVLERLRCRALSQGRWSDLPVTPQMFG